MGLAVRSVELVFFVFNPDAIVGSTDRINPVTILLH